MESQEDKELPMPSITIPSTFTRHFGGNTPDLEYNTPVSVCFRSGEVQDGTLDDFDFNAQHSGYLSEIVGYRVRSDVLGTLGPAIGIPATLGQQVLTQRIVRHPMDGAKPTPKATRDNPIPVDRPSEEEKFAMNIPTGDNLAIASTTPPHVKPVEQPYTYTYAAVTEAKPEDVPAQEELMDGAKLMKKYIEEARERSGNRVSYKEIIDWVNESMKELVNNNSMPKVPNGCIPASVLDQYTIKKEQFCAGINPDWNKDHDYKSLSDVLERAYQQAAHGKGKDRHAQDLPFDKQPMQTISQLVGSADGLRYQAIKKIQEAARLDRDAAVRELLGAINYIAGTIIYMESEK